MYSNSTNVFKTQPNLKKRKHTHPDNQYGSNILNYTIQKLITTKY